MIAVALFLIIAAEVPAFDLFQFLVGGGMIVWAGRELFQTSKAGPGHIQNAAKPLMGPGILALILVIWGAIQLAPLGFLDNDIWQQSAGALSETQRGRITTSVAGTSQALVSLIICSAFFVVSYLRAWRQGSKLWLQQISGAIILVAALSLVMGWLGTANDFFMEGQRLRGPLLVKNEFAALLSIAVLVLLAHTFSFQSQKPEFTSSSLSRIGRRSIGFIGFGILIIALALTESRGASIALVLSIVFWMVAIVFGKRTNPPPNGIGKVVPIKMILTCLVLVLAVIGGTVAKLARVGWDDRGRWEIYRASLEAIKQNPFTGTGMGSYPDAIAQYFSTPTEIPDHAHNDFLETIMTFGLPMAFVAFGLFVWLGVVAVRGWNHGEARPASILALSSLILLGVHSLMDHPAQSTAVLAVLFAVLGSCLGQIMKSTRSSD